MRADPAPDDVRLTGAPLLPVLPPGGTVTDLMAVLERAVTEAREQHPKTRSGRKSTSTATAAKKTTARKSATGKALPPAAEKPPSKSARKKKTTPRGGSG